MKFSSTLLSLLFVFFFQIPNVVLGQEMTTLDIALRYLESQKEILNLTSEDIKEYQVSDLYTSKHNGVTHVYLNQTYQNIEVNNALFNANILPDGKVLNFGNRFVSNIKEKIKTTTPSIAPEDAIRKVIEHFEIETTGEIRLQSKSKNGQLVYSPTGLAMEPIPVKLVYEVIDNETVNLAWMVQFYQLDAKHWWNARVDAQSGTLLVADDQMLHCSFGNSNAECSDHVHTHDIVKRDFSKTKKEQNFIRTNSYNVFPMPVQSPSFGDREIVSAPANLDASPFGWHDTDGVAGAEFTITRGNNVHAYQDIHDLNRSSDDEPDGGPDQDFDFPLDLTTRRPYTQIEPAVTNLFYWNNIMHDLWYNYGFDEVAGNFQANNYGKGGEEGDFVTAEALDGSRTNNAVFGTDADGSGARMQMFLWTNENLPDPPEPELLITAPDTIEGRTFPMIPGGFGGILTNPGFTAKVVLAEDSIGVSSDLCEDITNAAELNSNIALIDRGSCQFGEKMLKAEQAGAIAVIICTDDRPVVEMGPGVLGDQVTIPGVMLERADCDELKLYLDELTVRMETPELVIANPGPRGIDGDFDNGVIAHEYGHGLSIRMTGGPSRGNCLNSREQAGEGWSDWFGMVMTTTRDNNSDERRGIGTYAIGEPTNGRGIRTYPYSRDMSIDPDTYANVEGVESVHRIGSIWCAMIWDLYWDMIDEHSFHDDIFNGDGGNNMAMQLVVDGIKLQPCNPDFIDSRDAILAADRANYGGANECLIWRTFARRGLGFSARPGGDEAFDVPAACDLTSTSSANDLERSVTISPNPNDGVFNVKINNLTTEVTAQITNVAGSLLLTKKINPTAGGMDFDLSDYQAGVYLLHLKTADSSVVKKVVVN